MTNLICSLHFFNILNSTNICMVFYSKYSHLIFKTHRRWIFISPFYKRGPGSDEGREVNEGVRIPASGSWPEVVSFSIILHFKRLWLTFSFIIRPSHLFVGGDAVGVERWISGVLFSTAGLALTADSLVHNLGHHIRSGVPALPKHLVDAADVYLNITLKKCLEWYFNCSHYSLIKLQTVGRRFCRWLSFFNCLCWTMTK